MSYFITIGVPTQLNISTLHLCYKDANSSAISQSVFLSAKKLFTYFCIHNGCSTDILGKSNNNQVSVFIDDMKSLSAENNVLYYFTHFYRGDIYSEKIDDYETIKIDLTTFITEFPNLKEIVNMLLTRSYQSGETRNILITVSLLLLKGLHSTHIVIDVASIG